MQPLPAALYPAAGSRLCATAAPRCGDSPRLCCRAQVELPQLGADGQDVDMLQPDAAAWELLASRVGEDANRFSGSQLATLLSAHCRVSASRRCPAPPPRRRSSI
jgi:hypothetical protein